MACFRTFNTSKRPAALNPSAANAAAVMTPQPPRARPLPTHPPRTHTLSTAARASRSSGARHVGLAVRVGPRAGLELKATDTAPLPPSRAVAQLYRDPSEPVRWQPQVPGIAPRGGSGCLLHPSPTHSPRRPRAAAPPYSIRAVPSRDPDHRAARFPASICSIIIIHSYLRLLMGRDSFSSRCSINMPSGHADDIGFIRMVKKHPEIAPVLGVVGVGCAMSVLYMARLMSHPETV